MDQKNNNINKEDFEILCIVPYIVLKSETEIIIKGIFRSAVLKALQSFCKQNKILYFIELLKSKKESESSVVFYCEKKSLVLFEKENENDLKNSGIDLSIIN